MKSLNTIILLFFICAHVEAGTCKPVSDIDKYKDSDYIYHGEVIESKLMKDGTVLSHLRIIDEIKSSPDQTKIISESGEFFRDNLFIVTGFRYLVFGKFGKTPSFSKCSYTKAKYKISPTYYDRFINSANKSLKNGTAQSAAP